MAKTYRPVCVNVDADLLDRVDAHRAPDQPRSRIIHEALERYLKETAPPPRGWGRWK